MRRSTFQIFLILITLILNILSAKLPDLDNKKAAAKLYEIMTAHATHKELTPEIAKRALTVYLDTLDSSKTYFIESDIAQWIDPSQDLLRGIVQSYYQQNSFPAFTAITKKMKEVIERRRKIEKEIDLQELPKHVKSEEFKDQTWAKNLSELKQRIARLRALQLETLAKVSQENKEQISQLIAKRQAKMEEDFLNPDPEFQKKLVLTHVLKAVASSLDSHTAYFTPEEARQFMINVQQRLFGIGAQLRDDLNGFTIVKIVEGGPAAAEKKLKVKDRIIAVDGEPVVGMDILEAVDLIRGEEGTTVNLTIIREEGEGPNKKEEKLDIKTVRGEVVLKETRYDSYFIPFGNGGIAYLRLYSFYQDPESSSAQDLANALEKMAKEHKRIFGVVLDLRSNSGGMLSQAVAVAGLFITKGIVVSIKDEHGQVQHLRDIDGAVSWDGPLVVLVNRGSASASEIVAQTLQDYRRSIIVGDKETYGKGSFQTFTLNSSTTGGVNPEGEYKVTRGRYYTVSGKTPQQHGVESDIVVPGTLSESEVGEKFTKFPLEADRIKENFDDDLSDIPFTHRAKLSLFYKYNLQPRLPKDEHLLEILRNNSRYRIEKNKSYQEFLKEIKKEDKELEESEEGEVKTTLYGDLQLEEGINVMRDLILIKGSVSSGK